MTSGSTEKKKMKPFTTVQLPTAPASRNRAKELGSTRFIQSCIPPPKQNKLFVILYLNIEFDAMLLSLY
jgi:hypothetical protein